MEVLKDNINEMIRNLRETTRKNAEQDWLKTNLAKFSRMLQGQRDLQTVAQQILSELEIECLVTEIPNTIVHIVSEMKLDDVLHIKDIKLPAGVRALQDEDLVVAQVKAIEEEAPAVAEGETAEPEVIGRKAEDEGAAAEGEEK